LLHQAETKSVLIVSNKFLVFQRTKDTAQNEQHLYFKLLIISKKQNLFFISAILLHYQCLFFYE
ncbi:hypothetical protein, partial [Tenacibaculum maritimum]|uniref:hypothetical protein n=1 Tax=Tenacibaculum maritimum TaxID=107401 RepID=UPI001F27D218